MGYAIVLQASIPETTFNCARLTITINYSSLIGYPQTHQALTTIFLYHYMDCEKAIERDSQKEPASRAVPNDTMVIELVKSPSFEDKIVDGAALDYSGAAKKTDPREIELVKKLDWHIMVRIL